MGGIDSSMLEIQNDQFLILECETKNIEMYQMKIFYYRTIAGIKSFRFSMTEKKSYLYYPDKNKCSLNELAQQQLSCQELLRILEQIRLILIESKNNLLYDNNFSLRPEWIYIDKQGEQIKVELVYLPLKSKVQTGLKENYISFIRFVAKLFNEMNAMEYFYYFKRLDDVEEKEDYIKAFIKVLDQLSKERVLN